MKPQIIPAILVKNKKEFFARLDIASKLSGTVQIDIMDGLFVKNKTPRDLNKGKWFAEYILAHSDYRTSDRKIPDIELHLMTMDPWAVIREWNEFEQLKRVIWHVEAPIEHAELIETVHDLNVQAGLAINPKTPLAKLTPYLAKKKNADVPDHALVMGVTPGWSGQKFKTASLAKIRSLRKKFPKLSIGVDGGMNDKTAKKTVKAGANVINAAGAIYLADDPIVAYNNFNKLIH